MDVVYLCRAGENEELRWSMRSLKNLPHDKVWIFGGKPPAWVTGVEHVDVSQEGQKAAVTTRAMRAACNHDGVSDPFIVMNDDFFIVKPQAGCPVWHQGTIEETIERFESEDERNRGSEYMSEMRQTLDILEQMGFVDPLSYELHTPLVIYKETMLEALDLVEASGMRGAHKRSVYGAFAFEGGTQILDGKLARPQDPIRPDVPCLSSLDQYFQEVRPVLRYLLGDDMSEYESYVPEVVVKTSPLTDPICIGRDVLFGGKRYPAGCAIPLALARQMYQAGFLKDARLA